MTSKRIILLILTILITGYAVFAIGVTEENGWLIPHSSVNNENSYWDILSDFSPDFYSTAQSMDGTNAVFQAVSTKGELFRLRNSLKNTNPVTISTVNNEKFVFTHSANVTLKRPYKIYIQELEWDRKSETNYKVQASQYTQIANSPYNFNMMQSTWKTMAFIAEYCSKYYEYEIFIELDPIDDVLRRQLEPGDYYSDLEVSYKDSSGTTIKQNIRLKAVYGESNTANNSTFSLSIQSTDNSYNLDLDDTIGYHSVAKVDFQGVQVTTAGFFDQSDVESNNQDNYKVLISPYPNLTDDAIASNENPYYFKLMNSGQQTTSDINTVYYNVYSDSIGTSFPKYSSGNVTYNNTYVIAPTVEVQRLTNAGNNLWNYQINWRLNSTPIYIKALPPRTGNDLIRASGLYTSTIYFYVITTT